MATYQISEEQKEKYREQAEIFKALSSPVRLCILSRLIELGSLNVSTLVDCMCISQSSVSQHLAKLRSLGIVQCRKVDNQVFYTCERADIVRIIRAMRGKT